MAFDTYKTMLQDQAGHISGPRTVIAGFGAGITESLLAVTPFESIKTTLLVLGPYELCRRPRLTWADLFVESMTANLQTRVCEASYTVPALFGMSVASADSFRGFSPPPPVRLPIPPLDSVVTLL